MIERNLMKRSVLIIINKKLTYINELRREFDPLFEYLKPHITIVFPFESEMDDNYLMKRIKNTIQNTKKFHLVLKGFSKHVSKDGFYIYYDIEDGIERCLTLHNLLYKESFALKNIEYEYIPHVTVGRFNNECDMEKAYQLIDKVDYCNDILVESIALEKIGINGESIIIETFDLN